jgi:hypothetical protein
MFHNADSGLYLTQYRAYDPVAGRWLSRDPVGDIGNQPGSTISTSLTDALSASTAPTDISGNVQPHYISATHYATRGGRVSGGGPNQFGTLQNTNTNPLLLSLLLQPLPDNPVNFSTMNTNLYIYVDGNPTAYIDPDGEDWRTYARVLTIVITCKRLPESPGPGPKEPIPITMDVNER